MPSSNSANGASTPKICIIGTGFSGLCAAIQLKRQLGINSFTVFEANNDIGGTWYVNKYPGCECDLPVHLYSFSFERNPDWTATHGSREEIWEYLKKIAIKYDLYPRINFNTFVKSLKWDENQKKWRVEVFNKETNRTQILVYDIILNGAGKIRVPRYPEIFTPFKGPIIHSAEWDGTVELKNKVVAVVGSGSTGVQLVPAVKDKVKKLVVYQRSAPYTLPRGRKEFSATTKFIFAHVPLVMWIYRCYLFLLFELFYFALRTKSYMNKRVTRIASDKLNKDVKDEILRKKLTPNYLFGCKRFTATDSYCKSFNEPHVKLITSRVATVTADEIQTEDGLVEKIDVILLATGFKPDDFFFPATIHGRNGENISKTWTDTRPSAYYGIISHTLPNHFILLGPNALGASQTVIFTIECQVNYIIKVIKKMMQLGSTYVSVKPEAEEEYMEQLRKDMKAMVWTTSCDSWYRNPRGDITGNTPSMPTMYWWRTRNVDFSHFEFSDASVRNLSVPNSPLRMNTASRTKG